MYRINSAKIEGEIHFKQPWHHKEFGEWKVNMDSGPDDAYEAIMELGWEETHRQWDSDHETWVVDLDKLWHCIDHLSESGFEITVEDDVLRAFRDEVH